MARGCLEVVLDIAPADRPTQATGCGGGGLVIPHLTFLCTVTIY